MVPFIIGGIALAATGYGVKKYLENDDNREKVSEVVMRGCDKLDEFEQKGLEFFDNLEKKIDEYFDENKNEKKEESALALELNDNDVTYILPELQEYIDRFEDATRKLYNSSLLDLQTALSEIKNLERNFVMSFLIPIGRRYNFVNVDSNIKETFNNYTATLLNVKEYVDVELDKLDEILLKSSDYNSYSDSEKAFIQKLLEIRIAIERATQSKMTFDGENFSREVKRAFKKLGNLIKQGVNNA